MRLGLQARMDRLFNRHGDGRAICVAADHGYMSDVTANVVNLRPITEAVIAGGRGRHPARSRTGARAWRRSSKGATVRR